MACQFRRCLCGRPSASWLAALGAPRTTGWQAAHPRVWMARPGQPRSWVDGPSQPNAWPRNPPCRWPGQRGWPSSRLGGGLRSQVVGSQTFWRPTSWLPLPANALAVTAACARSDASRANHSVARGSRVTTRVRAGPARRLHPISWVRAWLDAHHIHPPNKLVGRAPHPPK